MPKSSANRKQGMAGPSAAALGLCAALWLCLAPGAAMGLRIENRWSPRNAHRPLRPATEYIILHTTEGASAGSLRKIRENGEAHYFVDTNGEVYRIVHRDRIATHAGRSMWEGRTNIDRWSIGIEIVGYHDRHVTEAQFRALRELLAQLQRIYGIPDENVMPHAMVAYGAPNRWHRRSHRGRKRCGMLFATSEVRRKIGLTGKPRFDPDVRAGRLVEADPCLARVLFGRGGVPATLLAEVRQADGQVIAPGRSAWDIARDRYDSASVRYVFPNGKELRGDEVRDWRAIPAGTRVVLAEAERENEFERVREIGRDGDTAEVIAGDETRLPTTIYFLPDGRIRRGNELSEAETNALPRGTGMLVGYVDGGYVTRTRSAFDICGNRWNHPSTFYRFADGSIRPGHRLDEGLIPRNTRVFFRN